MLRATLANRGCRPDFRGRIRNGTSYADHAASRERSDRCQHFDGCGVASLLARPLGPPPLPPLLAGQVGPRALLVIQGLEDV
jgi:hypothetical protein